MKLDIWIHHHRHGIDVFPMFREDDEPIHTPVEVIDECQIDFEKDREDECVEVGLTSIEVPSRFTPSEIGDLKFAMRAQRNRVTRILEKPKAKDHHYYQLNRDKLDRFVQLLQKLTVEEKHAHTREEVV